MHLKPSEIYFSQDSINNVFDQRCAHSYEPIGHTLDALCEGRCRVSDIPTITVVLKDGKWVTADNRRLWVFREMERLGKCDQIPVYEGNYIPPAKMTSYNGGTSVHVRGPPRGSWHNKPSARKPSAPKVIARSNVTPSTNNFSDIGILTDQNNRRNMYPPTTSTSKSNASSSSNMSSSDNSSARRHSPVVGTRETVHQTGPVYPSWTDEWNNKHSGQDTVTQSPKRQDARSNSTYKVDHEHHVHVPLPSRHYEDKACCIII